MARPERDRALKLGVGAVAGTVTVPVTSKYVDPRVPTWTLMEQPVSTLVGVGGGIVSLVAVASDKIKNSDTADALLVLGTCLLSNGVLKWSAILEPTPTAGLRIRRAAASAAPRAGAAFM